MKGNVNVYAKFNNLIKKQQIYETILISVLLVSLIYRDQMWNGGCEKQ